MRNRPFFLLLYIIFFMILAGATPLFAEEAGAKPSGEAAEKAWTVITSSYATIYVQSGVDLTSAVKKIDVDFAKYDPVEKEIFLEKGISDTEKVANKIDILVRKTRRVLDMYPAAFKINIKIYNNQEELNGNYKEIFEEDANYKAFYVHKFKTIYTSANNLSESVLAHEIGHSVIDSYFTVLPPPKIRELLACYVDLHLRD